MGRSRRGRRRETKRRAECQGAAATGGALALLVVGVGGDEYIDEKGGRFREAKAAGPTRAGAWPDPVSVPFFVNTE